jgi:hypothetical protein
MKSDLVSKAGAFDGKGVKFLFILYSGIIIYGLCYYVYRSEFLLAFDVNEAWNLSQVLRWNNANELYPKLDSLIINNYPPLYFVILDIYRSDPTSMLLFGRYLSIISTLIIGASLFISARIAGYTIISASFGALWYLQNILITAPYYVGMNDPSLFATSIMAISATLFLAIKGKRQFVYIPISLQVFGGFIKHNIVTIPLLCLLKYANTARRTRADLTHYVGISLFLSLGGFLLCYAFFGSTFFEQLLFPRNISFLRGFRGWEELPWDALLLTIFIISRLKLRQLFREEILAFAISFIIFFLQKMGDGVSRNSSFELEIILGLIVIKYFDNFIREHAKSNNIFSNYFFLVFLFKLLIAAAVSPLPNLLSDNFRRDIKERNEIAEKEISRVELLTGNTSCSISLICALAGKPLVIDNFAVDQKIKLNFLNKDQIPGIVSKNEIKTEQIDNRAQWPKKFKIIELN